MALTKIDDRGLKTPIDLLDNEKIRFGTGNDLEIYHSGSHSFIKDTGTGGLNINTSALYVTNAADSENMVAAIENGAVNLYYDGVKTFATTTNGAIVYGAEGAGAQFYLYADEGDDNADKWRFSTGNDGDVYFQNYADGAWETNTLWKHGAAVELYFDNIKTIETISNGILVQGTEGASGIINIYADEGDQDADKWQLNAGADSYFYIANYYSGSWETNLRAVGNGATDLYYDNSKKFETTSDGARVTGNLTVTTGNSILTNSSQGQLTVKGGATYPGGAIKFAGGQSGATDQGTIIFYAGTDTSLETRFRIQADGRVQIPNDTGKYECGSSGDLKIYHDGSHSRICAYNAGNLLLKSQNDTKIEFGDDGGATEVGINAIRNGAVQLFWNNAKQFETKSNGVTVLGDIGFADAGAGIDFGANSHAGGMTSEKFDAYEEGTFTPGFGGHSATGTFGYAVQVGRYTRVGNRVWFTIVLNSNSHSGTTSGNFRVTGLPFAVRSESPVACTSFWISGFNASAGQHGIATQLNQSEHIEFYVINAGNGNNYTDVAASSINVSSAYLKVDGCYEIDGA